MIVLGTPKRLLAVVSAAALLGVAASPVQASAQSGGGSGGNGQAQAVAQIVKIGPGVGALELATTVGTSVSQLTNTLAQAKAQAVDLGLVGTSLTAEGCTGGEAAIRPEQLPQPLIVDNRKGDASASSDEFPVSDILGGGRKSASATTKPASEASVTGAVSAIASVVTVSGGQARAVTRVVDKGIREAVATSSVDLDIGGLIKLQNLQWRAVHRTGGSSPATEGTFSVTQGTAGGVTLPIEDLGAAEDGINMALAETGITIDFPRIEHITKPNDVIRVTPLMITLKDSPLGKTALGPLLNASREQREELFNTIAAAFCQAAGALLVGDIAMNILSGTGFISVQVGGVEATSADLELFNPFGSNDPLDVADIVNEVLGTASSVLPSLEATGVVPAQTGSAEIVPVRTVCESVSKSTRVGCSKGAALPVGIAGLFLTAAVAAYDWRRRRALAAAA